MLEVHTDVAIIGAGVSGLMLALELACRGVNCIVLDDSSRRHLTAHAPSARTLNHFRRRRHGSSVQTHRGQQQSFEEGLRAALRLYSSFTLGVGCKITGVTDYGNEVRLEWLERGEQSGACARYVVGCDSVPAALHGAMGESQSAPHPARRAVLAGEPMPDIDPRAAGDIEHIGRFRFGRCFVVGTVARALTPESCIGFNASVEDAVNLGWKLAAVLQGWGRDALLDTYETERRPFAKHITSTVRAMEKSMLAPPLRSGRASKGRDHQRAQSADLSRLRHIHQLQADCRYESGIIAREDESPSDDDAPYPKFPASGAPGAFAPHVNLDCTALSDHFGRDFTLLWLGVKSPSANWHSVADKLGISLHTVPCAAQQAHSLYGADLVLIRPDGHITWRGDSTADADAVLRLATLK